jgi:hypothetical protein
MESRCISWKSDWLWMLPKEFLLIGHPRLVESLLGRYLEEHANAPGGFGKAAECFISESKLSFCQQCQSAVRTERSQSIEKAARRFGLQPVLEWNTIPTAWIYQNILSSEVSISVTHLMTLYYWLSG